MTKESLAEILTKHRAWLNDEDGGKRANLRGAGLRGADLREANLRGANLRGADLREANLRGADLSWADLRGADLREANLRGADLREAGLRGADLRGADLRGADLREADLSRADLRWADLRGADLREANLREAELNDANLYWANLRGANLSEAKGLLSAANYMEAHFERVEAGYIAYKTFGKTYIPPETWKIEPGAVIEETVNFDRCATRGSGINVAPLEWVRKEYPTGAIWKVLIRWEWLCGVCVPYMTDGKIRCERVELLETVSREKET